MLKVRSLPLDLSFDANKLPVHSVIFGDMGPATSPNEPLFFLHHANVDRAWAKVYFLLLHLELQFTNNYQSGKDVTRPVYLTTPASESPKQLSLPRSLIRCLSWSLLRESLW
jgi:hypothetical protein